MLVKPGTIIKGDVYLVTPYLYNLVYIKDNKLHINYLYKSHRDGHHGLYVESLYEDFYLYTDIFQELSDLRQKGTAPESSIFQEPLGEIFEELKGLK